MSAGGPSSRPLALPLAAPLTAGCAGDEDPGGNASSEETGPEECGTRTGGGPRSSGARIACRNATGAATHTETFPCPSPDRSAVSLATNTTSDALTVRVEDGANETLFEETYDHRGPYNDTAHQRGPAGNGTLEAERSEDVEGEFGVQAACAT